MTGSLVHDNSSVVSRSNVSAYTAVAIFRLNEASRELEMDLRKGCNELGSSDSDDGGFGFYSQRASEAWW